MYSQHLHGQQLHLRRHRDRWFARSCQYLLTCDILIRYASRILQKVLDVKLHMVCSINYVANTTVSPFSETLQQKKNPTVKTPSNSNRPSTVLQPKPKLQTSIQKGYDLQNNYRISQQPIDRNSAVHECKNKCARVSQTFLRFQYGRFTLYRTWLS